MRMWQTIRASALGRHVHEKPYAALVLSGGYEEAGDHGRFRVKAGDVIFHEQLEAHLDRFSETGAVVLNLGLPVGCSCTPRIARVPDVDSVARVAERSCRDAVDLLFSLAIGSTPQPADWPDELATALLKNPSLKLSQWGEENGIAPWSCVARVRFGLWCFPRGLPCAHSRSSCIEVYSEYAGATRKHCGRAGLRRPIAHDPER